MKGKLQRAPLAQTERLKGGPCFSFFVVRANGGRPLCKKGWYTDIWGEENGKKGRKVHGPPVLRQRE